MLATIKNENDLSIDLFKSILDSVHEKGIFNNTLYSNIFDPKNGVIYLYHQHHFDEVVMLNVNQELAKGRIHVRIKDLFSQETAKAASKALIGSVILLCISILLGTGLVVAAITDLKMRKSLSALSLRKITQ